MRLLIIGGSGQTGSFVINEALQRGHTVTALVRNPSAIPARQGLTLVKGTPLESSDIEKAFTAIQGDFPRAIIVTIASPKEPGTRIMADSHKNLVATMRKYDISKIATLSSFGTGSSFENMNIMMRLAIPRTGLAHSYADHNLVEDIVKRSGLDYVLLRPARLTLGEKAPIRFHGDEGKGAGCLTESISRVSVAVALVDAVEMDTWNRSTPVISN